MFTDFHQKVTAEYRRRAALVYVRQCSRSQVFDTSESLLRQYALRDRALALGWPLDRIHTIHSHFDGSGSPIEPHEGFAQLLGEVALGRVGIVLAVERSRFTRQPAQWQQLIEACTRTGTLISLDSGLYDPAKLNDRYRLDGTLSAAQLRVIKTRLQVLTQVRHVD
jgi:DNA invertase Pin-like site-specific DNA recombinase